MFVDISLIFARQFWNRHLIWQDFSFRIRQQRIVEYAVLQVAPRSSRALSVKRHRGDVFVENILIASCVVQFSNIHF